jgi:hypothetical protein
MLTNVMRNSDHDYHHYCCSLTKTDHKHDFPAGKRIYPSCNTDRSNIQKSDQVTH